jgi:DNA-binding transcriptional regulator YiaG
VTNAEKVRAARAGVGEDTATFGARWHRSKRTVEDWEQGRRQPDPLVIEGVEDMLEYLKTKGALRGKARTKKKQAKNG